MSTPWSRPSTPYPRRTSPSDSNRGSGSWYFCKKGCEKLLRGYGMPPHYAVENLRLQWALHYAYVCCNIGPLTGVISAPWTDDYELREIIVRGQSYFSRLPEYWPPPHPPLRPASLSSPRNKGGYTLAGRRGWWGSIFWKTREIGLPSYNDLSTIMNHRRYLWHLKPRIVEAW